MDDCVEPAGLRKEEKELDDGFECGSEAAFEQSLNRWEFWKTVTIRRRRRRRRRREASAEFSVEESREQHYHSLVDFF